METQWQTYQALELIPESVPCPHPSWFLRLLAPLRRSFSDTFVRDLSYRHQVLLFKRCFAMGEEVARAAQDETTASETITPHVIDTPSPSDSISSLNPQQQMAAQQWISRGGLPWWTWYDS